MELTGSDRRAFLKGLLGAALVCSGLKALPEPGPSINGVAVTEEFLELSVTCVGFNAEPGDIVCVTLAATGLRGDYLVRKVEGSRLTLRRLC